MVETQGFAWEEWISGGLSERDICTRFITPALRQAGWDEMLQIREEVGFTKGRIIVRGKLVTRGQAKRADYIGWRRASPPPTKPAAGCSKRFLPRLSRWTRTANWRRRNGDQRQGLG
jgi:hypothetical protein